MKEYKMYLGVILNSKRISFGDAEDKIAEEAKIKAKAEAKAQADVEAIAVKIKAEKEAKIKAEKEANASKSVDVNIKVEIPKVEEGKNYTAAEVKQIITDSVKAGASTTKNQLHSEMDKLKERIAETETQLKASPENSKLNDENIELKTKLKILEEEVTKVVIKSENMEAKAHTKELAAHKLKLIADAGGRIVEEILDSCDTIEALDEAAIVAKAKYESYSEKVRKEYNLPKEEDPTKKGKKDGESDGEISVDRLDPRDPASVKAFAEKRKEVTDGIWEKYLIE